MAMLKKHYLHFFRPYQTPILLVIILLFSLVTKVYNLSYPDAYVFDEVYVRFTAEQIAANNPKTWVWDYKAPDGFAYGWSHPKLGKQIMALAIILLGPGAFSARIVPVIMGTLLSLATFLLAKHIFPKKPWIALLAAAFMALDGLVFTLSRVGLADTQLCLYLLVAIYFLLKRWYPVSALFWGMAISVKWTGIYFSIFLMLYLFTTLSWQKKLSSLWANLQTLFSQGCYYIGVIPVLFIAGQAYYQRFYLHSAMATPELFWSILRYPNLVLLASLGFLGLWVSFSVWNNQSYQPRVVATALLRGVLYLFGFGPLIYILSYTLFFVYGFGVEKFIELQNQMFWYHTNLVATHPWQSPAISWPLNWRPVWFWVDYQNTTTANIYAMGNPLIFWGGVISVFFTWGYAWVSKQKNLFYLLLAYLTFWVPWMGSPRIMFLYHYLPALPYLCIMLAFMLITISQHPKTRLIPSIFIALSLGLFWYFYPHWTGVPIAKDQVEPRYQWLESWKP